MRIDIITCLPDLFCGVFTSSIIGRALKNNIVDIKIHNLRDYSNQKHKKIDDYQYGGGSGMVLSIEPIYNCITELKKYINYDEIIYMCPDGEILTQSLSNKLSMMQNIIILCGHYKGIDERIRENIITKEISIGEYVVTGGELPAAILTDSVVRLIPGVISNFESALTDSFQENIIGYPLYTRPQIFKGMKVPDILLSGDHKRIDLWRNKQIQKRIKKRNNSQNITFTSNFIKK